MIRTTLNRRRAEAGHADGSFLRKLTMVCLATLVLSGLIVYWIGEITPPQPGGRPPAVRPSHQSGHRPPVGDTTTAGQRPTPARTRG
jgi:hypothetical protein